MRIIHRFLTAPGSLFTGGPSTATIQVRFMKPANTAQTRLQARTRDLKLDLIAFHHRRLSLVLGIYNLVSTRKRGHFVSLQLLSRWALHAGLNALPAGDFVRKYPQLFEVFTHPVRRNACCKFTSKFMEVLGREGEIVCGMENKNVIKIRKILMLSVCGRVHLHAIRLMRRELGLPEDFRDSIIRKYDSIFRMVDLEIVELIGWNEDGNDGGGSFCFVAEVEKWRDREYKEKWLSEFETKYAFPINFPTGFKIQPGFREKLKNWQRLSYMKPYEKMEKVRIRTCGGAERYEKRAVGIIHELLCLTVEKMVEIERLAHFRKDLGIEVNLRELVLKHPGIFYVSIRGSAQFVFLREAYSRGFLLEPCLIYDVRREMLELIMLGIRNSRELRERKQVEAEMKATAGNEDSSGAHGGDFVIQILENNFQNLCNRDVNSIMDYQRSELDDLYEKENA